ncbi:MAG TPA: hypothetical protein VFZ61_18890 [Polyangiales bacterium]
MPANMQAFVVAASYSNPKNGYVAAEPKLYRLEPSGQRTPLDIVQNEERKTVSPAQPVEPGTQLELEWSRACETLAQGPQDPPLRVRVHARVTAASPLPSSLGHLRAHHQTGAIAVPRGGSCSDMIQASYWDLEIELSAEAEPYRDLLSYELRVDGQLADSYRDAQGWAQTIHYGGSSLGRGTDRVYMLCNVGSNYAGNIGVGIHRVTMVGRLPDGTRLESDEVEVGNAPCGPPADASVGPDPNDPFGPDAAAHGNTTTDDAGIDLEPDDAVGSPPDMAAASEQGCALGSAGASFGGWLSLLTGLLLSARRRRG